MDGIHQITIIYHVHNMHGISLTPVFAPNKGCSKLISMLTLDGGIMNQSITVALVVRAEQRKQLRLQRSGTYVIMVITI